MPKKINPNSPDNLLGKWFESIDIYEIDNDLMGTSKEYILARGALSHLLNFADQNNKLMQMYNWLLSNEGSDFLENHSRASQFVYFELKDLSYAINWENYISSNDVDSILALKEWIEFYQCPLPSYLTLK
ncbi:hypothetical protein ICN10_04410 [Polynucleobacter sp. 86C-FISCH]|uniref:hypothetical protein n=1 Tax=Polynucleobacter sp. 86C-FISCH TaxID=2689101 RepID=UPI001C0AD100|nr:hypothetical protein [Polynucleobacter sp. 86C-FISCH]MBU3595646.1 hypothetical protein [Polynucleobacter sp. 86C-FISCH]